MTALCFVDTNVLLYRRDVTEPEKSSRAQAWFERLWVEGTGRLSYQVLIEYYANVRRLAPEVSTADIRAEIHRLLLWQPVSPDPASLARAWAIQDRYSISWWDALIVAAAKSSGCSYLLSEDFQDGQDFDGVLVVDPFARAPDSVLSG